MNSLIVVASSKGKRGKGPKLQNRFNKIVKKNKIINEYVWFSKWKGKERKGKERKHFYYLRQKNFV